MKPKQPVKVAKLDMGITDKDRAKITQGLSGLLADSYTLYLTTHNFHWNVTGPMFNTLHLMFMGHYTEQWNALDLIAERIRALGRLIDATHRSTRENGMDAAQFAGRVIPPFSRQIG